jgi:hypothetical protein
MSAQVSLTSFVWFDQVYGKCKQGTIGYCTKRKKRKLPVMATTTITITIPPPHQHVDTDRKIKINHLHLPPPIISCGMVYTS